MAEEVKKDDQQTEKPMDKMTVAELREALKSENPDIKGLSGMKKDQLLEALQDARGSKNEVAEEAAEPEVAEEAAEPEVAEEAAEPEVAEEAAEPEVAEEAAEPEVAEEAAEPEVAEEAAEPEVAEEAAEPEKVEEPAKAVEAEKPIKIKAKGSCKGMTVKEIKEKINRLCAERESIRQGGDKKKIEIIRRRINRLRKMTRKAA